MGKTYTYSEWVEEAKEYGLWVCIGQTGTGKNQKYINNVLRSNAAILPHFMMIYEPLSQTTCQGNAENYTETDYKSNREWVQMVNPGCKLLLTDGNCNSYIQGWTTLDGIVQETFSDAQLATNLPLATAYKQTYGKFTGSWIWFRSVDLATSTTPIADTYFNNAFNSVYSSIGNTFLWQWKDKGTSAWESRVTKIKKTIGNKAVTLPVWQNFTPGTAVNRSAPDCQVQVKCEGMGLNPASVQCYYAIHEPVNGNTKWIRHLDVSATGTSGTKNWVTITAKRVPFNQASETLNKVMFKITDTYTGNYFKKTHTVKREYVVKIAALDWQHLSNKGIVNRLPANLSIKVNNAAGIDTASAKGMYSKDGGNTWNSHPVTCSGPDSSGQYTVHALEIPFTEDKAKINKIRFSINTTGGDSLMSADYPVKVILPPVLSNMQLTRIGDTELDLTLKVQDATGLRIGRQEIAPKEETVALYHMNGNVNDASGNGFNGTLFGSPKPAHSTDNAWKGVNTGYLTITGRTACYAYMGHGPMGPAKPITFSMWIVKQGVNDQILGIGDYNSKGSLGYMWTFSNQLQINAKGENNTEYSMYTPVGALPGGWLYNTFVFDGQWAKFYSNGELIVEKDWTGFSVDAFRPLKLGGRGNTAFAAGTMIDEVHLVSKALSEAEIASEYHSGVCRYSSDSGITWSKWIPGEFDLADGTTEEATMTVKGLPFSASADSSYRVQFAIRDVNNNVADREFVISTDEATVPLTKVIADIHIPDFYPNPFQIKTQVNFELKLAQRIHLAVYDISGIKVRSLAARSLSAGTHTISWDGRGDNNKELNAGQYFARIKIGNQIAVKRLMMLK
ncbi:MAG: T9SS type A sorting domain-containing protein [Fibrobacteria bacterium]|nr:T9SS type A sorting domain-containing protein [Fibrobacteria bacterium]